MYKFKPHNFIELGKHAKEYDSDLLPWEMWLF